MAHFQLGSSLIGPNSDCIPSYCFAELEMTSGKTKTGRTRWRRIRNEPCVSLPPRETPKADPSEARPLLGGSGIENSPSAWRGGEVFPPHPPGVRRGSGRGAKRCPPPLRQQGAPQRGVRLQRCAPPRGTAGRGLRIHVGGLSRGRIPSHFYQSGRNLSPKLVSAPLSL